MVCIALSAWIWPASGGTLEKFLSEAYGYTARYPSDWYLVQPSLENLSIENFPPSETVTGVRLPTGGASINLLASETIRRPTPPHTVPAWISIDSRHTPPEATSTFELEKRDLRVSVTELTGDCCDVAPPFQTYVAWYFSVGGRLFKATLLCWKGDPNLDKLRETLKAMRH